MLLGESVCSNALRVLWAVTTGPHSVWVGRPERDMWKRELAVPRAASWGAYVQDEIRRGKGGLIEWNNVGDDKRLSFLPGLEALAVALDPNDLGSIYTIYSTIIGCEGRNTAGEAASESCLSYEKIADFDYFPKIAHRHYYM